MDMNPGVDRRSNGAEVFLVQMILAVNPTRPKWCVAGWSAYCKDKRGPREKLFIHTPAGKAFYDHEDRPPHYYGERFWSDVPAFMSARTAKDFRRAAIRGGWCKSSETRVVRYSLVETVEVV